MSVLVKQGFHPTLPTPLLSTAIIARTAFALVGALAPAPAALAVAALAVAALVVEGGPREQSERLLSCSPPRRTYSPPQREQRAKDASSTKET